MPIKIFYILYILPCVCRQPLEVIERVVTHPVAVLYDQLILLRVFAHVVADHEECGLYAISL